MFPFSLKFSGSGFEYNLSSCSSHYWSYSICKQVGGVFPEGGVLNFLYSYFIWCYSFKVDIKAFFSVLGDNLSICLFYGKYY